MELFKKSFLYLVGFAAVAIEETERIVKEQRKRVAKMLKREEKPAGTKA